MLSYAVKNKQEAIDKTCKCPNHKDVSGKGEIKIFHTCVAILLQRTSHKQNSHQ